MVRMMPIRQLSPTLANQIAAGEVVERPASVLKELLENCLDAGAQRIQVHTSGGGTKRLQVQDDGTGIAKDELVLALARHATSKIGSLEDLEGLVSLGFRGEALPSIASVARLELRSCVRGSDEGWLVVVDGSAQVDGPRPTAHPPGTTVAVRDLFFNTPARRKFLRTTRTEQRHVEEVFRRVVLSRFDIGFSLTHEEHTALSLPVASDAAAAMRRVGRIFGRGFVEHAVEVDASSDDLRLRGWLCGVGHGRAQADCQYMYVNGRSVRDSLLRHALRLAYQDLIEPGRHSAYALYLEVDPASIDVNVHPTKHELRFRDARLVHDFLFRSVERALRPVVLIAGDEVEVDGKAVNCAASPNDAPVIERAGAANPEPRFALAAQRAALQGNSQVADSWRGLYQSKPSQAAVVPVVPSPGALGSALGLVDGKVILARADAGLHLIDVARARRLVWIARMHSQLQGGALSARALLLPATLRLPERCCDRLESWEAVLAVAALECRRIGPTEVSLRTMPVVLGSLDDAEFGRGTLTALDAGLPRDAQPEPADVLRAMDAGLGQCDLTVALDASVHQLNAILRELEAGLGASGLEKPPWVLLNAQELLHTIQSKNHSARGQ